MQQTLHVFPTSRAIRDHVTQIREGFLPTLMGMGDFIDRVILSDHLITPDDDLRLLALHEASNFSAFEGLSIERNFFTFIQNSTYIFRFFEELATEMVPIEALEGADLYGEYEEHIAILKQLWRSYGLIVESKGWSDPIFSKSTITLHEGYLRRFETITVYVEGYLSRYELSVLRACAAITPVVCYYHATAFNDKMSHRWREEGFAIEEGYTYTLNLQTKTILSTSPLPQLTHVTCEVFGSRMVQMGFIKGHIAQMVAQGIAPEKIVIVLPDESFVPYCQLFDPENNFNFAMGLSLENEEVIRHIEAIELYLNEHSVENTQRLAKVPHAWTQWLIDHYYRPFGYDDLKTVCAMMIESARRDEVKTILQEECDKFAPLVPALEAYEFKSALRIYLSRVKSRTIDDVQGGKITVMGVLETRGVTFDGVIVVDFNEGYAPHKSQKDLFLNTKTRKMADLPTTAERESLQKHYYWMLFARAKAVAIGCVHTTQTLPSRFLVQLGIEAHPTKIDYGSLLFPPVAFHPRNDETIEGEYDFCAHPLSASGLKAFLSCKRQFYYRYLQKIPEHRIAQDLSREADIGTKIHAVMEKIYQNHDHYTDVATLKNAFVRALESHNQEDGMERYLDALWSQRLNPFYHNEIERFNDTVRVLFHEKKGECVVEGITLVGRMDRIDATLEGLEILDYKTGNFADTSKEPSDKEVDYQLAIYALLAHHLGTISRCGYYDLKTGKIYYEQFLEEKIDKLREILRTLATQKTYRWSQCDTLTTCRYCPYTLLCQREG